MHRPKLKPVFSANALLMAVATAVRQETKARRRNQIGPGVRRTAPKPGRYGRAAFCGGKQECERNRGEKSLMHMIRHRAITRS